MGGDTSSRRSPWSAVLAGVISITFACDEPREPAAEPTTGEEAERTEPAEERPSAIEMLGLTPPDPPWAEMDAFEREMYMVGKVLPIMQEVFRAHDPERYAELACETCHGEDMREVQFRMPSPRMYRIPREGTPAYQSMLDTFGPTVRFMQTEVTPKMAAIMGQPELSCASCHPTAP